MTKQSSTILSNVVPWLQVPTLPEGEEDDRLDGTELEDRLIGTEEFPCGEVEEEKSVQGQTNGDVINDGDVQVPASMSIKTKLKLHVYV